MPPRSSLRIVVACEEPGMLDEVVGFCEDLVQCQLVMPVRSVPEATRLMDEESFDAVVLSEGIVPAVASDLFTVPVIVIARRESPSILRHCLRIGAKGFVAWPEERRELLRLLESAVGSRRASPVGELTAVWGPKGGSGTSVLSAHLAGALAMAGRRCVLVDLDIEHGDQAVILGAENEQRGLSDLVRVANEVSPGVLDSLSHSHPRGFRAVLSHGSAGEAGLVKPAECVRALEALTELTDHVIADLPSGQSERSFEVCVATRRVVMVVTPDLLSLRRARDAASALRSSGLDPGHVSVLLNRSNSSVDIGAEEVSAVVGSPLLAAVRDDIGLFRSPGRGQLATTGLRLMEPVARQIAGLPAASPRRRWVPRR